MPLQKPRERSVKICTEILASQTQDGLMDLFDAIMRPMLTYGSAVWWTKVSQKTAQKTPLHLNVKKEAFAVKKFTKGT